MSGGEKKLRNQCVAHIVPKGGGGPLRCMMLEAKLSHLISLPKPGFSLGSKASDNGDSKGFHDGVKVNYFLFTIIKIKNILF